MIRLNVMLLALLLVGCGHDLADGQTQAGSLRTGAGLLDWEADQGGPRQMTPSAREAITDSLLRGEREVAYALRTGQAEGLRDLFAEAALDDARRVTGDAPYTWAHRVTLHFYAPDGATVSLTDRFTYLIPEGPSALRVARREEDRVLQLDDGNWRTHHWRVVRDEALPDPTPPGPAPTLRSARLGPPQFDWLDRSEDEWTRDLRAVRDLHLDTLTLPLDLRPGHLEQARTAAALARAGRIAARLGLRLQVEVRLDALSPRALRALHGALGAATRPPALIAVLLRPDRRAPDVTVRLWRQTLQARFGALALGTATFNPEADFTAARTATYRERRAPLGLLHEPRRTWQLRAFVRTHPQESVMAGQLYGPGGFLTPDGSFTRVARALTRPAERPGPLAFVWGWTLDLWPLIAAGLAGLVWRRARRRGSRRPPERPGSG